MPKRAGQAEDTMTNGELSAAISNAIVALMADYTGRGPSHRRPMCTRMRSFAFCTTG
jgi:hypothetical protein